MTSLCAPGEGHELGLPTARVLTRTVLLHLLKTQVVQLLLHTELFKFPLEVDDGLLDPLLTLISGFLAVLILTELFIVARPPVSLLLLLYPIDLIFQVKQPVFQVLYHQVLVLELVFHDLKYFVFLHVHVLA